MSGCFGIFEAVSGNGLITHETVIEEVYGSSAAVLIPGSGLSVTFTFISSIRLVWIQQPQVPA